MDTITIISTWTLCKKEVLRFLKVYHQTLLAPVVSAITFLFIFALSIGNHVADIDGIPFTEFMAYGLIIMSITQNAFANSSSSIFQSKIDGTIIDYVISPIPLNGFIAAYTSAAMARGVIVGILVAITISLFIDMSVYSYFYLFFFSLLATLFLAILGMIAGILSNSFDQMSAITIYLITPLSFLSGTFYSIKTLPQTLAMINLFNPFFYIIDGFRYSMTGTHNSSIILGITFLSMIIVICYFGLYAILKNGYRIKN